MQLPADNPVMLHRSMPAAILSDYLPTKLVPLPLFKRRMEFLKESNIEGSSVPVPDMPSSGGIPLYMKEKFTVRDYSYLVERDSLENSTYHKQQMLGRKNHYDLRTKLPPLKDGFSCKATFRIKEEKLKASSIFNKMTEQNTITIDQPRKSNYPGTNTLDYSQTGKHDDDTLFKFTDRHTVAKHQDEIEFSQVQEGDEPGSMYRSQNPNSGNRYNAESNFSKSHFVDSKMFKGDNGATIAVDMNDSQNLNDEEVSNHFQQKRAHIPEYNSCWFFTYSDFMFCTVTSLGIDLGGFIFYVPFAVAKAILANTMNLREFIRRIKVDRVTEKPVYDMVFFESIKNDRAKNGSEVNEEEIFVDGKAFPLE